MDDPTCCNKDGLHFLGLQNDFIYRPCLYFACFVTDTSGITLLCAT